MDCPSGRLKKDQISDLYSMLIPDGDSSVFVDQIFRIFDKDGNGSIDFTVSFDYYWIFSNNANNAGVYDCNRYDITGFHRREATLGFQNV